MLDISILLRVTVLALISASIVDCTIRMILLKRYVTIGYDTLFRAYNIICELNIDKKKKVLLLLSGSVTTLVIGWVILGYGYFMSDLMLISLGTGGAVYGLIECVPIWDTAGYFALKIIRMEKKGENSDE